jgi:hypothetical protein
MTSNAYRNESMTMHARLQAMKEQSWVDSDEFVKANVKSLSPEVRDLLDKIFVPDEFKRITMQVCDRSVKCGPLAAVLGWLHLTTYCCTAHF